MSVGPGELLYCRFQNPQNYLKMTCRCVSLVLELKSARQRLYRTNAANIPSGRGHQNSVNHLLFFYPNPCPSPASIMFKELKVTTVQNPGLQRGTNQAMKHAQLWVFCSTPVASAVCRSSDSVICLTSPIYHRITVNEQAKHKRMRYGKHVCVVVCGYVIFVYLTGHRSLPW